MPTVLTIPALIALPALAAFPKVMVRHDVLKPLAQLARQSCTLEIPAAVVCVNFIRPVGALMEGLAVAPECLTAPAILLYMDTALMTRRFIELLEPLAAY
jgi:hypothetical protein